MHKDTISTLNLMQPLPNNRTARLYIEKKRWNGSIKYPLCESGISKYVDKFTLRFNNSNVKINALDRISSLLSDTFTRAPTYKELLI